MRSIHKIKNIQKVFIFTDGCGIMLYGEVDGKHEVLYFKTKSMWHQKH